MQIKSAESVLVAVKIPEGEDVVLPFVMTLDGGIRQRGFDHEDPRPFGRMAPAFEDLFFHAFDINFEPVNLAVSGEGKDVGQREGGHAGFTHFKPLLLVPGRNCGIAGGEPSFRDFKKAEGAVLIGESGFNDGFVGAVLAEKAGVGGSGFDVNAAPAFFVEGFADGVLHGVLGADVDVETVFDVFEGAPEHDILEVLSVGTDAWLKRVGIVFRWLRGGSERAGGGGCGSGWGGRGQCGGGERSPVQRGPG